VFGPVWWWPWIVGAFLALIGELVHEIIENSECVIQLYRDNSGTSSQYEGDSTQNIVGDLLSCLFGWYITALLYWIGPLYSLLVLAWTLLSEVILVFYMRDCGLLICIQLICPIKAVQAWQAEGVPVAAVDSEDEHGAKMKNKV